MPIAVISARICSFWSIWSSRAFSTLRILPRSGRIGLELAVPALLGRAAGAVALDDEQLALGRVPGVAVGELPREARLPRGDPSVRVSSRALRAASRACAAWTAFAMSVWPTAGCSSRNSASFSLTALSTWPFTSELPRRALVCPSNWGSRTFTESTQ